MGVALATPGLLDCSFSLGGRGSLRRSQACLRAELGVIRDSGSHSKHLWMKSKNKGSSQPGNMNDEIKECVWNSGEQSFDVALFSL